ncbi:MULTISPECIES: diacylglycerol kinase family protein [unclassified Ruminococcus]|uniref:diacylglycerol kinase family protein n=1 Tax=unclassified Ruminococcus TaxID=2608920 RepID=UPI0021091307|nr:MULTISPECIES: diacylglycerol kinase family protein [unclassified Ruminococcus]MCQ4021839.1 hypothetical protein [Ruminococcus sp. zg-924]MCQ4114284.1 hypothetical protein [Ruminococcus sp. zg-921]
MKFLKGFMYAFKGVLYAIIHERNMRIHIVVTLYLLYFTSYYRLSPIKMSLLLIMIALVISLELVNTAVERVCNLYSTKYHRLIEIAKNVSAGAVLLASGFAVAVACFLLWEPDTLWNIVVFHCESPERFTLFVLTLVIAALFVVIGPKRMADNAKSLFKKNRKK